MISDGLRSPDVFISADAAVNDKVLMTPDKKLTDWYVTFASSAIVLGYNPNSKFKSIFEQVHAGKLAWYEALKTPGLKLGRTDPNLDPKGFAPSISLDNLQPRIRLSDTSSVARIGDTRGINYATEHAVRKSSRAGSNLRNCDLAYAAQFS